MVSKIALMFLALVFTSVVSANLPEQTFTTVDGQKTSLKSYAGKTLLVVNIATKCGYTPQLTGLEKLYQKYKEKGFVVLGVPSNDFMGQTPEDDKDVKKFCQLRYGVTFPLTSKVVVKGEAKSPLIKWLIQESSSKKEIGWNFEKFLVNKKGQVVSRYSTSTSPDDQALVKDIEAQL